MSTEQVSAQVNLDSAVQTKLLQHEKHDQKVLRNRCLNLKFGG